MRACILAAMGSYVASRFHKPREPQIIPTTTVSRETEQLKDHLETRRQMNARSATPFPPPSPERRENKTSKKVYLRLDGDSFSSCLMHAGNVKKVEPNN